jgi:hypothetical protein
MSTPQHTAPGVKYRRVRLPDGRVVEVRIVNTAAADTPPPPQRRPAPPDIRGEKATVIVSEKSAEKC